ncbi:hypothetical protein MHU86_3112 [Fragilaria crotonensis]|nr:hypothetical protein MHU86_3112 [Fragilaria crotonensis]
MRRGGFHLMVLFVLLSSIFALPVARSFTHVQRNLKCKSKLSAHILNTAFEWLADDRESKQPYYSCLTWLDPSSILEGDGQFDAEMPLYPIGATYLPSKTTHYLNNMEPRNVQMALDLARLPTDRRFCVVLSAADTGRIASVGTVMTVVDIDVQRVEQEALMIQKIRVTCRPVATVDVISIVNPQAASWESRIKKSPEYLKAMVRYRCDAVDKVGLSPLVTEILENYNAVRDMYVSGIGTQNLPPFAVKALKEALPEWTAASFGDDVLFWVALEQWQTLCNTVRESQQMTLSTNRNEIMVAAASAKVVLSSCQFMRPIYHQMSGDSYNNWKCRPRRDLRRSAWILA